MIFTGVLALFSIVQAVVLVYQAHWMSATVGAMTRQEVITTNSVAVMRDAALAAQASAKISERSLAITQRAFVFGKGFLAFANAMGPPPYHVVNYFVSTMLENVGVTPASDACAWIQYQTVPFGQGAPKFEPDVDCAAMTIGPRATNELGRLVIPVEVMNQRFLEHIDIYVWSRVQYRDVINPEQVHFHEQCARVMLLRDPTVLEPNDNNINRVQFLSSGAQNISE